MVTFRVDDVAPASKTLPTRPLGDLFTEALVVGGDPALPVLVQNGVQPLLDAVGRAFADHRPLVLSPDAVWLTILQGVAQHVRLHAEELRPRLVGHAGRKRLTVVLEGPMPRDASSWQDAVELFSKLLAAEIGNAEVFECDFSTSTDVERTAGRIVQFDAYSSYFALWMVCVCGIPSITLTGTVEDWQKVRARVDAIAAFGLETWCRSLVPIADQFVRAAAGDVDTAFWRITTMIDLDDGRSLGAMMDSETDTTTHWVLCRVEEVPAETPDELDPDFRLVDDPADIPVYGTSLAQLLEAALDSGGDITHLETGRLSRLL